MKNIHILKTNKPSRLFKIANVFVFDVNGIKYTERYKQLHKYINQNIYITSDEEIKGGDWFYDLDTKYVKVKLSWENSHLGFNGKKIILTTDQDLIKDGVQAIDDDFLEWFVKNPSCEWVRVIYEPKNYLDIKQGWEYEIIIPKEEPKPNSFCETPEEKCTMNYCDENGCQNRKRELVEPKETLEELKKWKEEALIAHKINQKVIKKLMDEKKRMCSEEEVIELLKTFDKNFNSGIVERNKGINEWLEQYKNKQDMKQTAVEWLESQIIKFHNWKKNPIYDENCFDEIELSKSINQAKEMEKQQIIDAYWDGCPNWDSETEAEQYYEQTFNK